jgi:hypothetical protein
MSLCVFAQHAHAAELTRVKHVEWTAKTAKKVRLEWDAQDDAKKYEIEVKHNGELLKTVIAEENHKVIKHLEPDTVYYFRVRAKNGTEYGAYSYKEKARTKIRIDAYVPTLFGFWGLNGYISDEGLADVRDRFHSTVFQVASSSPSYTVNTLLPMVRDAGMHVTLRMTDDHDRYITNGDFDIDKWKTQVAVWADSGVQEFIDDHTLIGHMLLDDIDTFEGLNPTAEELDEMAKYSKEVLPHLMTFVRQRATWMPVPNNSRSAYKYLDAVDNQYKSTDGDAATYAQTEYDTAKALHVQVIQGMNIADGGDGSSGQPGWREGKYAMSADEITEYGNALLTVPSIQLFLLWEYDAEEHWSDDSIGANYFDQSDLQEALAGLGASLE